MIIDASNFINVAMHSYDNPQCKTIEQFEEDIFKFSILKKYLKNDDVDLDKVKLTLNLIVSLFNIFETESCIEMMFYKVREEHWFKLKTYLVYMNRMPDALNNGLTQNSEIGICHSTATQLRKI